MAKQPALALFVMWGLLLLAACSGGGGDDGTTGTGVVELSGTAATDTPVANASVTVKDRDGKKYTTTTDANGKYTLKVPAAAQPYLVKIETGDTRPLYATAALDPPKNATSAVANVHPLSDVTTRNWFGVRDRNVDDEFDDDQAMQNPPLESELAAIRNALRALLRLAYIQFGVNADTFDFDRTPFDANEQGFHRVLMNLTITFTKNKMTILLRDPDSGFQAIIIIDFDLSDDLAQQDTSAPTVPTGLAAIPASTSGIVVIWNSATDNVGIAGYNVYRDDAKIATTPYPVFSDTGLATSTQYCYAVEAFDGAGNTTAKTAPVCVTTPNAPDTTAPSVPPVLPSNAIGTSGALFKWTPALESDTLGYDVYRGARGTTKQKIAVSVASSYTDTDLAPATEYCYQVRAFDAALNRSDYSDEVCVTTAASTTPGDTTAPTSSAIPVGGTYSTAQFVTLNCDDGAGSGCAAVYYTLDGNEPTTFSPAYTQPITIGASSTLRFYAIDQAGNVELPKNSVTYVITDTIAPTNTTASNFVNGGATSTNSKTLALALAATDNIAVTSYYVVATVNTTTVTAPTPDTMGWNVIAPTSSYSANVNYTFPATAVSGDIVHIHVWFKDAVGNVSGEAADSIVFSTAITPSIFFDNYENGLGDWYADNGIWEVGAATSGPNACYNSSTQCAATVLAGNYPDNVDSRLVSPTVRLPTLGASEQLQLRFWHWFVIGTYDAGYAQISEQTAPGVWATWTNLASFTGSSSVWTRPLIDLSAYAGKTVRLGFLLAQGSAGGFSYVGAGWYVDDVTVTAVPNLPVTLPYAFDFDAGMGDWSADNGIWEVGAATSGPNLCYNSSSQCAATVLAGNYPDNVNSQLVSPSVQLPTLGASEQLQLRFWHWFAIGTYDVSYVQISEQTAPGVWAEWTSLTSFVGSSSVWTRPLIDLSAYAGKTVRVGFLLAQGSAGGFSYVGAGWYVDNVTVTKQ